MSDLPLLDETSEREIVAQGNFNGIEWAAVRAPLYGAVNGYVRVPDGHPWFDLETEFDMGVPWGCCTYQSGNWFGFDTLHSGQYWPEQKSWRGARDHETLMTEDLAVAWTRQAAENAHSALVGGNYQI